MINDIAALRAGDTAKALDALDQVAQGTDRTSFTARWARRAIWRGLNDAETARIVAVLEHEDVAA